MNYTSKLAPEEPKQMDTIAFLVETVLHPDHIPQESQDLFVVHNEVHGWSVPQKERDHKGEEETLWSQRRGAR
ncbi:MAG: hypothetical protein KGL39_44720 [Patescibacteria group bacterium]|nr:hypothetical protein [Patescibacteria group bacterium]